MHGRCAHLLGTVSRYPSPDFDSPSRSFPYSMTPVSMDGSRCFHCTMALNRRPAAIHSSQDGVTKHSKLSVQRLALIPAMLHLHWPGTMGYKRSTRLQFTEKMQIYCVKFWNKKETRRYLWCLDEGRGLYSGDKWRDRAKLEPFCSLL